MKYSIITINFNNSEGLRKTIASVVNQTFKNFEFIIIDGGSTDGSVDVIKEYADKIDYWVSEQDKGVYNAMNKGILKAHGEYLNFMNSGDCFYNNDVLNKIKNYSEDLIIGDVRRMDTKQIIKFNDITSFYSLCVPEFNHQSIFFKRKLFSNRIYDENLKIVADWKLLIQCIYIDQCSYKHINVTIADYECGGVSSNTNLIALERNTVLKEILPPLIYNDYKIWTGMKIPILYKIKELAKHYRLLCCVDYIITKLLVISKSRNKYNKI